ncbi:MAG: 4-(cytidine 5'-diphospho)-2-C-methyl-D-erythritol kinase [Prevotella sp.]|jgi:4-diphosphocytidyl-2-C-methyl-D-erythritol kinase|uniref:4-(cytidine 5'-diphospho)-2-C-methyl-D-erythritol kinase n=1 Tax=Prevotella sp. TaxID=59823 RepID=UPI001DE472FF|nr:4-(cytidine 5'-diphospho)-2-C-methyl-D-erythritol kinase [Prevotella sp.]MBD9073630.1 4-(cytidine 5'-diphospho)-2-C-methyl-D-erythritol kinase [Prevotella sp.]MBD9260188.1 4-(cytidine 5'-diphospho)-2-C-methyl-D-erythritol kinase [Prevotella sp.]MEE0054192.1 4-(cytidine 5'-diphospho)-2-C-methyl-D-erythritol kinase [Prevotella sp.]
MITFPCAKINLGLNIVSKRPDGYHNLETVFYPIPLTDALEIKYMDEKFPSESPCDLKITGNDVDCNEEDNLVIKAYQLLAADFQLPRVHAHLVKRIPTQAGLGGGSSDAAYMIRLLDERFRLNIGIPEMERYAAKLGADCAFFITADPSYAEGIGDVLMPVDVPGAGLGGYYLAVVKPSVAVSTRDAYAAIVPKTPAKCCRDIVRQPIETWKDELVNDFEAPIFAMHPELAAIKQSLYDAGAVYAAMSGSGSALFGIFREQPTGLEKEFEGMFCQVMKL